ncbi:MAG: hypothetical protein HC879_08160 [Leptolyngbyaceae cyanobacterium SL_5_9]|nr:hypothetical protein [Leptolyngbyaceae cyanobacterium SL_5_9]NJO75922.1 hypothetical protein [Leptolyngbyaceae cyanobacterium RM1_406_9]
MHHSFLLQIAAIPLIATGLLAAVSTAPVAAIGNDYQTCASELLGAGISEEEAAAACAGSLNPEELSECVIEIDVGTAVEAADALSGCRRVRRPEELSTCVVDIAFNVDAAEGLSVLDYCRRSLLPERFSECVMGLRTEVGFPTDEILNTCIAAGDRPRDLSPTFIPVTPSQSPINPDIRVTPILPMEQ